MENTRNKLEASSLTSQYNATTKRHTLRVLIHTDTEDNQGGNTRVTQLKLIRNKTSEVKYN